MRLEVGHVQHGARLRIVRLGVLRLDNPRPLRRSEYIPTYSRLQCIAEPLHLTQAIEAMIPRARRNACRAP